MKVQVLAEIPVLYIVLNPKSLRNRYSILKYYRWITLLQVLTPKFLIRSEVSLSR